MDYTMLSQLLFPQVTDTPEDLERAEEFLRMQNA